MKKKTIKTELYGTMVFKDHEEPIIKLKVVEDTSDILEIVTPEGLYVYDMSEPFDDVRCRLYKQVITHGSSPQTIESQLHVCDFEYIDLTEYFNQ